jgi:thioredoxin reductase/Pyruvate/2-oxoacid:ferredoxin oxidoreductase delta subunit
MDPTILAVIGGAVVFLIVGVAIISRLRRKREARDTAAFAESQADQRHLPPSLHPVIDADICIGSLSCITACPEGDILGVVDGVAKLIVGSNCIGHGRCATECPVNAIKLVFGTSERGVDLPEVDGNFESSRPGVHIVGELGGMGLIKNAITQGLQVAEHLGAKLGRGMGGRGITDVAIVGAGPAGLGAALGLTAAGVSYRILDQGVVGGAIASYPRQKVVMTEKLDLPMFGKFGRSLISKEELLGTWQKIMAKAKIRVEENVQVTGIQGDDGDFLVETNGEPVRARKVVLATGRRGSPRKLGVPGEDLPKVTYNLIDPDQYAGKRVLVVGGGDSAIEAAMQLAENPDNEVAISYRQSAFAKCREANRNRIGEMIADGKLHAFMSSNLQRVTDSHVELDVDGRPMKLPNDYVIGCLGGELPVGFLQKAGVAIVRHHGEERGTKRAEEKPQKLVSLAQLVPQKQETKKKKPDRLGLYLFLVGAAIIAGLTSMGLPYYLLSKSERMHSPMHESFRSSGTWGHGVGIIATAFMMGNFLYALRKRWGFLKGSAPIRSWLTWHMFVGFMSPLVILFHAAFQSNNHLATSTYLSLLVVVGTGIVGRYVYGLVPSVGGTAMELSMVRAQMARHASMLTPLTADADHGERLTSLLEAVGEAPEEKGSLILHLLKSPFTAIGRRFTLSSVRPLFPDTTRYREFRTAFLDLVRLRTQVRFYRSLRRLLSGWRAFHVVLAVFLVVVIAVHVAFSIFLGYRWIFS